VLVRQTRSPKRTTGSRRVAAQAQADADVASAKAAVDTAHINLTYTRVLSPISGRTGRSSVTEGALVAANQSTALVVVQQLDPIYVDVTQPSTTLLRLQREFASGQLCVCADPAISCETLLVPASRGCA
jgi:membrane fusion protein (multidrug efflux system)